MRTELVLDAPRMALTRHGRDADVWLSHHSDAGSQPRLNQSSTTTACSPGSGRSATPTTTTR
jgi:hypothetical protein